MSSLAEITADLEKKTVPVLKELLRGHHAELKGLKAELVARLAVILVKEASSKPETDIPVPPEAAPQKPAEVSEQKASSTDAAPSVYPIVNPQAPVVQSVQAEEKIATTPVKEPERLQNPPDTVREQAKEVRPPPNGPDHPQPPKEDQKTDQDVSAPVLTQQGTDRAPPPKEIDVQKRIEDALRKRLQEQHQAELAKKAEQSPKRQRVEESPQPRRSRSRSRSPDRPEPVRREQRPVNLSLAVNAPEVERLVTDIPPPSHDPTDSLRISNFKRPCPLPEVKALLAQTGTVTKFWMNNIRSECLVSFASVDEASATRREVFGVKYPLHNDQTLVADFCDSNDVDLALGGQVATVPAVMPAQQSPSKGLEELFRKTAAQPAIYWRPNDLVPENPIQGAPVEDSN